MAITDNIPGLGFFKNINFSQIFQNITTFVTFLILILIVCGIIIFVVYNKKQSKLYSKKIHFFEEVNGQTIPVEDYLAAELIIPNTNVHVFHIKSNDLYLPRGVRRMGKDSYWYSIRNNREIVNFSLKNINEETGEAGLNYDHTDMRYAQTNLRELIKRNYRDKSTKWWQEYKDVIATVIFIFVLSISFFFLTGQMNKIADKFPPMIEQLTALTKNINQILENSKEYIGSGIKA